MLRFIALALVSLTTLACGGAADDTAASGAGAGSAASGTSSAAAGGDGGGALGGCEPDLEGDTIHLAAGGDVGVGQEATMCLRWTAPETLQITGFSGTLGPSGHHALLMGRAEATEPDGLAPCSEASIMDASVYGDFQMLAGVSYESSGLVYDFPSAPVQVGLVVPKGTQLIFDAHFLNASAAEVKGCATLDLYREKPVVAKLGFVTLLSEEQYSLSVPAHGSLDVAYEIAGGGHLRIAAASSHMHEGGTHFRLSIKETDQTVYETTQWADPVPAIYDTQKLVIEEGQSFVLECSFTNDGDAAMNFPQQMCIGGLYVLSCGLPGAC